VLIGVLAWLMERRSERDAARRTPTDEWPAAAAGPGRVVRLPAGAVRGGLPGPTGAPRRAAAVIGNAWVYTLSMGVYCTAWTYFGSVGRAATSGGVWFLPIYLGPTLAMVLAWLVLRKMIRIARTWRITSIADFIASRYGKSRAAGRPGDADRAGRRGALRGAAAQGRGQRLRAADRRRGAGAGRPWWRDTTLYIALALAGFTIAFGTRHLDTTERHEGMVAAIAAESVVKLLAFLAVGVFVTWGLFDGPGDLFARAGAARDRARAARRPGAALRLRPVVRAAAAGHAVGDLAAAPVPGDGGRERRRAPRAPRRLGLSGLPAADQPVRAADRAGRLLLLRQRPAAPTPRPSCCRCRWRRHAGAGAGGLHRRAVGGHRHGHRGGHRRVHHGLQRPGAAAAAALRPLALCAGARPDGTLLASAAPSSWRCCCWAGCTSASPARPTRWSASA
jgi:hypothetical protein